MYRDDNERHPFAGKLAEVRLWNVVRSQEQLRRAMRLRLRGDEPGLTGYWPMDEGGTDTVQDRTQRGYHGTISGATWGSEEVPFSLPSKADSAPADARVQELEQKLVGFTQKLAECNKRCADFAHQIKAEAGPRPGAEARQAKAELEALRAEVKRSQEAAEAIKRERAEESCDKRRLRG